MNFTSKKKPTKGKRNPHLLPAKKKKAGKILKDNHIKDSEVIDEYIEESEECIKLDLRSPPSTIEQWNNLALSSHEELTKLGLGAWNSECESLKYKNMRLYLLPEAWFNYIPPGFNLVDLSEEKFSFDPNSSDRDNRFGYLAYGIIVKIK
jgi:hypothetical protein